MNCVRSVFPDGVLIAGERVNSEEQPPSTEEDLLGKANLR